MKISSLLTKLICLITCLLLLTTTGLAQVSATLSNTLFTEQTHQLFNQQHLIHYQELSLIKAIGQTTGVQPQLSTQDVKQTIQVPNRIVLTPQIQPTINQPILAQLSANNVALSQSEQRTLIQSLKRSLAPSSWPPNLNSTWQVQLLLDTDTPIKTNINAEIYDIEIDAPQEVIDQLHSQGHKVICYLNAGTAESFRLTTQIVFEGNLSSDAQLLELWRSRGILGNAYSQRHDNEFWMNPRSEFVRNYIEALLNKCKRKGFDGVSFDNLDGYVFDKWNPEPEKTGFNLSRAEQLEYNLWLIEETHKRGLYAGLKNTGDLAEPLSQVYDWVFAESCYSEKIKGWDPACENYVRYFATKGKAIYLNEYDWNMQKLANEKNISLSELRRQYCAWAEEDGIFLMFRVDDTTPDRLLCSDLY